MNEQGARHFTATRTRTAPLLVGDGIGAWHEVTAAAARFVSPGEGMAFALRRVPGARLYRGRELIGSRLAWSGFGYSLPPTMERFSYDISIEDA